MIISLWVTQTLVVFQLVYKQCTMEVLFVDWEPARAPDPQNPFPVSAWRSIFVALGEFIRAASSSKGRQPQRST